MPILLNNKIINNVTIGSNSVNSVFVGQTKVWPDANFTLIDLSVITEWEQSVDSTTAYYKLKIPTNIQELIDAGILILTYGDTYSCDVKLSYYKTKCSYTFTINSTYSSSYGISKSAKAPNPAEWIYEAETEEPLPGESSYDVTDIENRGYPVFSRLLTTWDSTIGANVHVYPNRGVGDTIESTDNIYPYTYGSTLSNIHTQYSFAYWTSYYRQGITTVTKSMPSVRPTLCCARNTNDPDDLASTGQTVRNIIIDHNSYLSRNSGSNWESVLGITDSYVASDGTTVTPSALNLFYNNTLPNKLRYSKPWKFKESNLYNRPIVPQGIGRRLNLYCKAGSKYNLITAVLPSDFRNMPDSSGDTYRSNPGALYGFESVQYIVTPEDLTLDLDVEAIGTKNEKTRFIAQGPVTVQPQDSFYGIMYLLHPEAKCMPYYPGIGNSTDPCFPGDEYHTPVPSRRAAARTIYSLTEKADYNGYVYTKPLLTLSELSAAINATTDTEELARLRADQACRTLPSTVYNAITYWDNAATKRLYFIPAN